MSTNLITQKSVASTDARQGFTLIELLIVIAIIGILSGIGITQLNGGREKARNAQALADARAIMNALIVLADDNNGVLPLSHCFGQAPTCFSYGTGFPNNTCLGAGKPGNTNSYCRLGEYTSSLCNTQGVQQAPDTNLAARLLPYISRNIQTNPILSPVEKNFTSGYPSFVYISNSPGGNYWGYTNIPAGAYFAWFKAGCQSFSSQECPSGYFLPSNCGNDKNGCAYYLGANGNNPGTPYGSCTTVNIDSTISVNGALRLRWF